jgi:hypothetical protein
MSSRINFKRGRTGEFILLETSRAQTNSANVVGYGFANLLTTYTRIQLPGCRNKPIPESAIDPLALVATGCSPRWTVSELCQSSIC